MDVKSTMAGMGGAAGVGSAVSDRGAGVFKGAGAFKSGGVRTVTTNTGITLVIKDPRFSCPKAPVEEMASSLGERAYFY